MTISSQQIEDAIRALQSFVNIEDNSISESSVPVLKPTAEAWLKSYRIEYTDEDLNNIVNTILERNKIKKLDPSISIKGSRVEPWLEEYKKEQPDWPRWKNYTEFLIRESGRSQAEVKQKQKAIDAALDLSGNPKLDLTGNVAVW